MKLIFMTAFLRHPSCSNCIHSRGLGEWETLLLCLKTGLEQNVYDVCAYHRFKQLNPGFKKL